MQSVAQPLDGSELVLVAQVPKAGGRWHQVHFNVAVMWEVFRLKKGTQRTISLARVDPAGVLQGPVSRQLVFSEINLNLKLEFEFGRQAGKRLEYPATGRPLLLVLELDLRRFRYQTLMPGDPGHAQMLQFNEELPPIGRGVRRGVSNLDEVELRWPGCSLRFPKVMKS